MKQLRASLSTLLLSVLLVGCASSEVAPSTGMSGKWTLFYTANRQGEVDPCGCQINQIGGITRMAAFLEDQRKEVKSAQLLVDAGDTFFSSLPLNPGRIAQEKLRAQTIAESFQVMGLDAFTPGERDFAAGVDFLTSLAKTAGTVMLASNLRDEKGDRPFESSHLFTKQGQTIGVFGLVDPAAFKSVAGIKVDPPQKVFEETVAELRGRGAKTIVLLSHLGLEQDRALAKRGGVDLIVGAHSMDSLARPEVYDGCAIVQTLYQGQQIGRFEIFPGHSEKNVPLLVDLDESFERRGRVADLVRQYRDRIREAGLTPIDVGRTTAAPPLRPYVANAFQCRKCHEAQYDFWARTKHAAAPLVLFAKNQHFDPECIGCHSLGFEESEGFSRVAHPYELVGEKPKPGVSFVETVLKKAFGDDIKKGPLDFRKQPERFERLHHRYTAEIKRLESQGKLKKWFLDVQCENCHGNRNGHPSGSIATQKKVKESTCRTCHTPPNAPDFDPKMIALVACPLMKRK